MDLLLYFLILLSLILFASSLLSNQKKKIQSSQRIEQKLDKIINLLEKKEN